jgi:hypothetical protein
MSTPTKVAGFLIGLAAVFFAALGVGAAVGPVGLGADQPQPATTEDGHAGMGTEGGASRD